MQGDAGECLVPISIVWGCFEVGLGWRLRFHFQKLATLRELLLAVPVTHQTVVTDALQSLRQDVQQEAADELVGLEGHGLSGAVVAVVLPAESDFPVLDLQETIVRDRDAMSIAADVVKDLFWSGKGCFGVDHPFLVSQRIEIAPEGITLTQLLQSREE